ncbi:MAG: HAMP domain-containing sensor histidine kinase [Vicinamibacterales bacterium]
MRRLRLVPLRLAVPLVLMVVLAVLAALQYHWLGQVSQAERQRMHETMTRRAEELASDIDREIALVYLAFQVRPAQTAPIEQTLAARHKVWRETSRHPDLIKDIYAIAADGKLRTFDPASGVLTPVEWPQELQAIQERGRRLASATTSAGTFTFRVSQTILTDPLAVLVSLPIMAHRVSQHGVESHLMTPGGSVLLVLDQQKFAGEVLPQLVAQRLGDSLDEYRLTIVRSRTPDHVVYVSNTTRAPVQPAEADIKVGALGIRPAVIDRLLATELRGAAGYAVGLDAARMPRSVSPEAPPPPPPAPGVSQPDRVAVIERQATAAAVQSERIVLPAQRGASAGGTPVAMTGFGAGAWQVLLKHRAGSLEAAVQRVRRRNLIMSFGMLALLGASVGLVLVSARRAERLASQQMDFVATVSHELRTPLAVIRSAGQNLADGVVQDPKRYGELIETEGRRLTDMVEQTLALAGLSGERRPMAQQPVDAGDVARAVLASPETSSRATDIDIELRVAEELPLVLADEMLLRRGVQNLVGNALKYGASGGWIGVTVDAAASRRGREVRITVSDRGPGVAAGDLPHIFNAFYRGRRAVADQVQGNGLGLHLVKRIAEAHGGRVTVRTAPGQGAAFTIHIPSRADLAVPTLAGEQPA